MRNCTEAIPVRGSSEPKPTTPGAWASVVVGVAWLIVTGLLRSAPATTLRHPDAHHPPGPNHDDEAVVLQILVGSGWVTTNHDREIPFLEEHREKIQDQREVGLLSPVEFLADLLEWHVDAFLRAAEQLEVEVEKLDDAALRTESDLVDRLVAMRRRIAHVRRMLTPHREVYSELTRPDFLPQLDERE